MPFTPVRQAQQSANSGFTSASDVIIAKKQQEPTLRDKIMQRAGQFSKGIDQLSGDTGNYDINGITYDKQGEVVQKPNITDNAQRSISGASNVISSVAGAGNDIINTGLHKANEALGGVPGKIADTVLSPAKPAIQVGMNTLDKYAPEGTTQRDVLNAVGNVAGVAGAVEGIGQAKNLAGKAIKSIPDAAESVSKMGAAREARTINNRLTELNKVTLNNAPLRKVIDNAKSKGFDVNSDLAKTNLLQDSIDKTGTINTENAISKLNDFIRPQEDVVSNALRAEGKTISLDEVRSKLIDMVNKSGVKGGAKIRALKNVEDDIEGYRLDADANGNIPVSTIHEAKVDKYGNINYLNPESAKTDKIIAKGLKEIVEDSTQSVDVKALNNELSRYYTMQNLLEKLHGKKVEGGRLGKYFAQTMGTGVGGLLGNAIGGPFGAAGGAAIGSELAGAIKGSSMAKKFGKGGADLEMSPLMKETLDQSQSTGNLNTAQTTNIPENITSDNVIPNSIAQEIPKKKDSRLISEESYQNAVKSLDSKMKNQAGQIKSSVIGGAENIIETVPELVTIAAYHIENGVRDAAELAVKLGTAVKDYTKEQLDDLFNKGKLTLEVKKYDNVDDFVKAQGDIVYHGGNLNIKNKRGGEFGLSTTPNIKLADFYANVNNGKINEFVIDKNANIATGRKMTEQFKTAIEKMYKEEGLSYRLNSLLEGWAKKNNYDGISLSFLQDIKSKSKGLKLLDNENEIRIFNENIIKPKQQLTDIWNNSQKSKTSLPKASDKYTRDIKGQFAPKGRDMDTYQPVKEDVSFIAGKMDKEDAATLEDFVDSLKLKNDTKSDMRGDLYKLYEDMGIGIGVEDSVLKATAMKLLKAYYNK